MAQLNRGDTEGPDIRFSIVLLPKNELWRHPARLSMAKREMGQYSFYLSGCGCNRSNATYAKKTWIERTLTVPTKDFRLPILWWFEDCGGRGRSAPPTTFAAVLGEEGVPTASSSHREAATPRSPRRTVPSSSISRFAALISRWIKPLT